MNRKQNRHSVVETHRANLQKRLEHRIEVAKSNGDENLVRLLEAEMRLL
jgi:hypothetical protein